jgi:protein-tyrosine phosphatase
VDRFTILHVCVGNICRSPMAERLLRRALHERLGDRVDDLFLTHGAGTGSWHVGEPMNLPAARQLRRRGADPNDFQARQVSRDLIDMSDLVLCATSSVATSVLRTHPEAAPRTFVFGEFGRLLASITLADLPSQPYERGRALVAAADAARTRPEGRLRPVPSDDLDDPWGMPDAEFSRVADEIEQVVVPLADALTGGRVKKMSAAPQ